MNTLSTEPHCLASTSFYSVGRKPTSLCLSQPLPNVAHLVIGTSVLQRAGLDTPIVYSCPILSSLTMSVTKSCHLFPICLFLSSSLGSTRPMTSAPPYSLVSMFSSQSCPTVTFPKYPRSQNTLLPLLRNPPCALHPVPTGLSSNFPLKPQSPE